MIIPAVTPTFEEVGIRDAFDNGIVAPLQRKETLSDEDETENPFLDIIML